MASKSKMSNPKSATEDQKRSRLITIHIEEEEEEQEQVKEAFVSSQIRLMPARPSEKLDKDLVLRRIRHRKRVNKVKNAVQSLFTSPFSSNPSTSSAADNMKRMSVQQRPRRWVDDAFAAL